MTSVMLFCTAEEAKPFIPDIIKPNKQGIRPFKLVESFTVPKHREKMREELHEGEPIHSPFIGASEDQCESWALARQGDVNYLVTDILAIADARTAQDGTILVCYYRSEPVEDDFPEWGGPLPPRQNTWYNWRVTPEGADEVILSLTFGDEPTLPTFFGMKKQLTDENGIFDTEKAASYMMGKDPETGEHLDPFTLKPLRR